MSWWSIAASDEQTGHLIMGWAVAAIAEPVRFFVT
jgi:hypothetical protein